MPIGQKFKDDATKSFEEASAKARMSMNATDSKVFDGMNMAMNRYVISLVHLIYGLSAQIDDLKADVQKLQASPGGPALTRTLR